MEPFGNTWNLSRAGGRPTEKGTRGSFPGTFSGTFHVGKIGVSFSFFLVALIIISLTSKHLLFLELKLFPGTGQM